MKKIMIVVSILLGMVCYTSSWASWEPVTAGWTEIHINNNSSVRLLIVSTSCSTGVLQGPALKDLQAYTGTDYTTMGSKRVGYTSSKDDCKITYKVEGRSGIFTAEVRYCEYMRPPALIWHDGESCTGNADKSAFSAFVPGEPKLVYSSTATSGGWTYPKSGTIQKMGDVTITISDAPSVG